MSHSTFQAAAPKGDGTPRPLPEPMLTALRDVLRTDQLIVDAAGLERFAHDETETFRFPPAASVLPESTEEVQAILRLAFEHRVPVVPRGAGTGLSGGALPVVGGLVLCLERMRRIRHLDRENGTMEVEAGVTTAAVQEAAAAAGLYYPPDPSSRETCLIGGNLAEDSAGPRSCKYGSTRHWVLGLEAVLADGTLLRTGGANRKDVAGYNLTQLLIGSEGTLAVLTAATLRLIPQPAATGTFLMSFPTVEAAARTVEEVFASGHQPSACELMDAPAIDAVGAEVDLPPGLAGREAVLLFEIEGASQDDILAQATAITAVAESQGGSEPAMALDPADERRLWQVRRKVGEAVKHRSPYKEADTVVPRSRLAELVRAAHRVALDHGLDVACYGHAADGNLHINLLRGGLADEEWARRRDDAEMALFQEVVALGGSVTGEHGIGWTQRRFLSLVVPPHGIALQRSIKAAFDPRGILNPSKVLPGDPDTVAPSS